MSSMRVKFNQVMHAKTTAEGFQSGASRIASIEIFKNLAGSFFINHHKELEALLAEKEVGNDEEDAQV